METDGQEMLREEAGESERERERMTRAGGQLINASSFNNANVITPTGHHTRLAPNHINTAVVERREPERERRKRRKTETCKYRLHNNGEKGRREDVKQKSVSSP